jgi:hypothetical protein
MFDVRSFQTLPRAPQPPERILKIGLEHRERRVDQVPPRDGDDVERPIARLPRVRRQASTEHLAQAPLRTVADDRSPQLPRRDDPETVPLERIRPGKQRHIPRRDTTPGILHGGELMTSTKPGIGGELRGHRVGGALSSPPVACVLWLGGV